MLFTRAFVYAPYCFLLISNKFWIGGGGEGNVTLPHWRGGMGPETSLRYPFKVTRGLLYIKPPMIYMALCVMLLMQAASITWASGRGLGHGNLDFFEPLMANAYRLDAISQGPTKSRFLEPNPLPLVLVMDAALIKSITLGAV